ncbi:MAG: arylsulfatase [Algoriphagus sp.]|uniref:arylsulfatase n=1 Tax=Algoriphagus sp. TaxID=1872435 RepID=UPI00261AA304|nr:arylsulfatase [Algoriphagus sp.]MDG1277936.1 arylsulfatase [Algoriphagus sp.]
MFRIFLLIILLVSLNSCNPANPSVRSPNVILILTDDQGYGDLGIHGNADINTPVLDQLGRESARFDRFYVSPLCAPTRASILTGRYHLRTGTISVSNGLEVMDASEYTLAELFKANGYSTGIFGKWHNGQHYPNHPLAQGFDEFTGFLAGHWSNYFDTQLEKDRKTQQIEGYLPDILTDEAIAFIEKNQSKPFFAYLPYNTPHSPHQVPDEYFDFYKKQGLSDELAAIHGMVSNIDSNIGRVLEKLDELGLEENTLVIFLTDNGPNGNRYNAAMKGIKGSVHEGGVRVPSFWKLPGVISPGLKETPGAHIDILPTLVDLLSLDFEEKKRLDGVSLAPTLRGEDQKINRAIFSQVAFPQQEITPEPGAIRKDSMLLVLLKEGVELYDLKNDPNQTRNLAEIQEETTANLKADYMAWWQEVSSDINLNRPIPISNQAPQILLAGYEAAFSGGIKFYEGHGWAQDWLTNWKGLNDRISWNLNVIDPGVYEVILEYSASKDQIGSELILRQADEEITFQLKENFEGELIPSPDRIPRKEAPEKTWKQIPIGKIDLKVGNTRLDLFAKNISPAGVGELYSLRLIPSKD